MISSSNSTDTLSKTQLKTLVDQANRAYDRGGADTLKIILDVIANIEKSNPEYAEALQLTKAIVDTTRELLKSTLDKEAEQKAETNSRIFTV